MAPKSSKQHPDRPRGPITKTSQLTPDAKNANRGTERGAAMISTSLGKYGAGRSILIDREGRVIGGNKTLEQAVSIGMEDIIVVQTDGKKLVAVQRMDLDLVKDKAARELAIADNRASELSLDWDPEILAALDVDLPAFWSAEELADLLPDTVADLLTDEDDVPPTPAKPKSKLGDIYTLGDHRLMCGDSIDMPSVERLMAGTLAQCMWTDPPYNVAYQTKLSTEEAVACNRRKDGLEVMNDSMSNVDFRAFLVAAFTNALGVCEEGAAFYCAHADAEGYNFRGAFGDAGWMLKQCLIWNKNVFVMGRQDYHWKHEPILYGWKPGAAHHWYSDRTQTTILDFDRPKRSPEHPTMKPVALVEYCLGNSSKAGDAVVDLFGGSGTTLMACEKLGRKARIMELSPAYTDVICERYLLATGKMPMRENGKPWKK